MVKFSEVVKIKRVACKKCFTLIYTLPCQVDRDLPKYLSSFGKLVYPLKSVTLVKIDSDDGYTIQSKLKKNIIKFLIPKHLESKGVEKTRKPEFEKNLVKWMQNKLDIEIEL